MTIAGLNKDSSVIKYLNKNIPIAAVLGGIFIALLTILSDLIGTIGSGTGILLVVNIVYGFYESFWKEYKSIEGLAPPIEF